MTALLEPSSLAAQFDRLPPHSIEAEMAVLGSLMLCGDNDALYAETVNGLSKDAFFQTDHQIIFDVIVTLRRNAMNIDPITVRAELERRKLLEDVGGIEYLARIINMMPSAANGPHYAKIVRDLHLKRRVIAVANDALRKAYGVVDDPAALAAKLAAEMASLAAGSEITYQDAAGVVDDCVREMCEPDNAPKFRTGMPDLPCLKPGRVYVICGNSSMGKSAWGKELLRGLLANGHGVGMCIPDETKVKVGHDFTSAVGRIDRRAIETGRLSPEQLAAYLEHSDTVRKWPFWIEDNCFTLERVEQLAMIWKAKHNIDVLYVDYLQQLQTSALGKNASTVERVTYLARRMKRLAKELNLAVIEICQINRGNTNRPDQRPKLSDLRDSGELENQADVVIGLHRESYHQPQYGEDQHGPEYTEVLVLKDKTGIRNTAWVMRTEFQYMRFYSVDVLEQGNYWRNKP